MQELRDELESLRSDAMENVGDLEDLRSKVLDLRDLLNEEQGNAARVDARGLPLIAVGILLTGVPDGLARWDWFGWFCFAVAGVATIWSIRFVLRACLTRT